MSNNLKLIEYMKLHQLSLQQDYQKIESQMYNQSNELAVSIQELNLLQAQIKLTKHYLSVADDILQSSNERE